MSISPAGTIHCYGVSSVAARVGEAVRVTAQIRFKDGWRTRTGIRCKIKPKCSVFIAPFGNELRIIEVVQTANFKFGKPQKITMTEEFLEKAKQAFYDKKNLSEHRALYEELMRTP